MWLPPVALLARRGTRFSFHRVVQSLGALTIDCVESAPVADFPLSPYGAKLRSRSQPSSLQPLSDPPPLPGGPTGIASAPNHPFEMLLLLTIVLLFSVRQNQGCCIQRGCLTHCRAATSADWSTTRGMNHVVCATLDGKLRSSSSLTRRLPLLSRSVGTQRSVRPSVHHDEWLDASMLPCFIHVSHLCWLIKDYDPLR